jgi:hypothetical protein
MNNNNGRIKSHKENKFEILFSIFFCFVLCLLNTLPSYLYAWARMQKNILFQKWILHISRSPVKPHDEHSPITKNYKPHLFFSRKYYTYAHFDRISWNISIPNVVDAKWSCNKEVQDAKQLRKPALNIVSKSSWTSCKLDALEPIKLHNEKISANK